MQREPGCAATSWRHSENVTGNGLALILSSSARVFLSTEPVLALLRILT